MDTWKVKCKTIEQRCFDFHKEFAELREKVKLAGSLQDGAKTHNTPSTLVKRVTELENTLKAEWKQRQKASDSAIEMICRAEEK